MSTPGIEMPALDSRECHCEQGILYTTKQSTLDEVCCDVGAQEDIHGTSQEVLLYYLTAVLALAPRLWMKAVSGLI